MTRMEIHIRALVAGLKRIRRTQDKFRRKMKRLAKQVENLPEFR